MAKDADKGKLSDGARTPEGREMMRRAADKDDWLEPLDFNPYPPGSEMAEAIEEWDGVKAEESEEPEEK